MKQIYFLCTGNSCRSQIAEGYAREYLGADWRIQSAGIESHGLNPLAVQIMKDDGIDISGQTSKLIDNDYLQACDLVVTLCGDAKDKCPMTPPNIQKQHWPLMDPAQATGTDAQKLIVFQEVRDEIKRRVLELKYPNNSL